MESDEKKRLAGIAIDLLRKLGVEYGDIRFVRMRNQMIDVEDRRVRYMFDKESFGFGIRTIMNGSWGFAGSNVVTPAEIERISRLSVEIANASATTRHGKGVRLLPQEPVSDRWISPVEINPFNVPVNDKISLLLEAAETMLKVKGVKKAGGYMLFKQVDKLFVNTEGSEIETGYTISSAEISATAAFRGDAKTRSYQPPPLTKGYELVRDAGFYEEAQRVGEEAVELVRAPEGPSGEKDLILLPSHTCLTIHESVGHATELDRVEGMEESLAGRSFATPDKLNSLMYTSPVISFVADNTLPGGLATHGYDDDGVPGKKWNIVRDGLFVGYSTNRETGGVIGAAGSMGCNRADSWKSIPIVRIPNLSMDPGRERISPDDLIADTKDGILIDGTGSFSIDQMRLNFQFGGNACWEIKNGRKTRMLKNVIYQAITTDFWNSCDAVCDERFWQPYGIMNCGKGDPMQTAQMTHGSAPARFRRIKVGGIKP